MVILFIELISWKVSPFKCYFSFKFFFILSGRFTPRFLDLHTLLACEYFLRYFCCGVNNQIYFKNAIFFLLSWNILFGNDRVLFFIIDWEGIWSCFCPNERVRFIEEMVPRCWWVSFLQIVYLRINLFFYIPFCCLLWSFLVSLLGKISLIKKSSWIARGRFSFCSERVKGKQFV